MSHPGGDMISTINGLQSGAVILGQGQQSSQTAELSWYRSFVHNNLLWPIAPLCLRSLCLFSLQRGSSCSALMAVLYWVFIVSHCDDQPHKRAQLGLTGLLFCGSCWPVPLLWWSLPISSLRCSRSVFFSMEGLSSSKCRICVTNLTNLCVNHRMMEISLQEYKRKCTFCLFLFN